MIAALAALGIGLIVYAALFLVVGPTEDEEPRLCAYLLDGIEGFPTALHCPDPAEPDSDMCSWHSGLTS